jgi:hypothetical protein
MKMLFRLAIVMMFVAPSLCLARKSKSPPATPDTDSLVTDVSITSNGQGTISISDDVPFVVKAGTAIVIDGHSATLQDVQKKMRVLSRTADDSSAPEIDLKTATDDGKNTSK